MRIKRDYFGALKRFYEWLISRFKPLTVHTEAIMIDDVWEEIQKKVKNKEVLKWYVMTPANYDYYKSSFNIKLSKKEVEKIMVNRYKWMIENGQKIELHIHLSLTMQTITYDEQERLFVESIRWFKKKLGITPREFVPGWWSYDSNTLKICKKLNLDMIHPRDYDYTHDYHWILK